METITTTTNNDHIDEKVKVYETFEDMPIFEGKYGLRLLQGIVSYGFEKPSFIQKRAIMPVAEGRDVIAQAQSGTGKTGTFTIGTLSRIDHSKRVVQAIILSHTHELALQTFKVVKSISHNLKTKVELCIGKRIPVSENIKSLQGGKHIIVGTPGRICDLIERRAFDISNIKMVVLDEADKLLSDKFHEKVADILYEIDAERKRVNAKLQICIFSATMPKKIVKLSEAFMVTPFKILVPAGELSLDGIKQYLIDYRDNDQVPFSIKTNIICQINKAKAIPQSIIYVNSYKFAEKLEYELRKEGMCVDIIHGKMDNETRVNVIKNFRAQKSRILVTTDLLARGIDIQQVSVVINFDLPYTRTRDGKLDKNRISDYIHRVGRGGRFGRKGVAINFVTTDDEASRMVDIEKHFQISMVPFPKPNELDRVFG
jgi:translation initiation factor 4A